MQNLGFLTTATVSTSIGLRKHGLILRETVVMKEETLSASVIWRTKALSSLNLDTVRETIKNKHRFNLCPVYTFASLQLLKDALNTSAK